MDEKENVGFRINVVPEIKTIPNDDFFAIVLERLEEREPVEIPLTGISMNPLLQEGRDNLLLAPLAPDAPLHRYDVVLFRYGDTYLLHRIRKINGDTLVTRGDAINSVETPRRSDVVAILTAVRNTQTGELTQCHSLKWKLLSRKTVLIKFIKVKVRRTFRINLDK